MKGIKQEHYDRSVGRYLYVVGDYTAVSVLVRRNESTESVVVEGKTYSRPVITLEPMPGRRPCIVFVSMRQDRNGQAYVDDDSPVTDALDTAEALKLRDELSVALELIDNHEGKLLEMVRKETER